jgi:hypothetical protein
MTLHVTFTKTRLHMHIDLQNSGLSRVMYASLSNLHVYRGWLFERRLT